VLKNAARTQRPASNRLKVLAVATKRMLPPRLPAGFRLICDFEQKQLYRKRSVNNNA